MDTISILGCGWLGMPLAEYLLKKGYNVKGSKTTSQGCVEMHKRGIIPFKIVIDPVFEGTQTTDFFNSEVLIINIPPKRREDVEAYHIVQIQSLIKELKKSSVTKVIFISSTSVYPNTNKVVTETERAMPVKGSGKALLLAEHLLLSETQFKTTVIRFGGLIGYDRMPGRFLAGKKEVENGDAPINVIHQDDCIELIYQTIRQNVWGQVFNACADGHPTRKVYYTRAALQVNLIPPEFNHEGELKFKQISSEKIKQHLNYTFIHPDPLQLLNASG